MLNQNEKQASIEATKERIVGLPNRHERKKEESLNRALGKGKSAYSIANYTLDFSALVEPVEIELRAALMSLVTDKEAQEIAQSQELRQLDDKIEDAKEVLEDAKAAYSLAEQEKQLTTELKRNLRNAKRKVLEAEEAFKLGVIKHTKVEFDFVAKAVQRSEIVEEGEEPTSKEDIIEHFNAMGKADFEALKVSLMSGQSTNDPKIRPGMEQNYQNSVEEITVSLEKALNPNQQTGLESQQTFADTTESSHGKSMKSSPKNKSSTSMTESQNTSIGITSDGRP